MSNKDKVYKLLNIAICMAALFFAVDAIADDVKTYGPKCYYEVTRVVENGDTVSETKVEVCEEETEQGDQKMDPELKSAIIEVASYATLIAILSKLN